MTSVYETPLPSLETAPPPAAPARWLRPAIIAATLVLAAFLIFARLGTYALWDDEAATALGAKSILLTGTNSALIDHGNIVAFLDGNALRGFSNQIEPLLPAYLTAASFALFGSDPWSGRLPFALFGLGTFGLILWWARRESGPNLVVLALGLIGNVSLILFVRNCRYYAAAIFFSVALAYLYCRRKPTVGTVAAFAGLSLLLFTSNLLDFVAFYACLAFDYLVWRRKQSPLGWRLLLWLFVPQLIVEGTIIAFWNPLQTAHGGNLLQNSIWDKLTLFYWQWRDTNCCEFLCLPLLLVAAGLGVARRHSWLVRGCVALAVYVTALTVISPQVVHRDIVADVRYLTPIIPLAIALEAMTLCLLFKGRPVLQIGVALLVFGTNFPSGSFRYFDGARSTLVSYLGELAHPKLEPYTATAAWINEHVATGRSVWVEPNGAAYAVMLRAPRALYAWQFVWPPRPAYVNLPLIHFTGQMPPDYFVAFGPYLKGMCRMMEQQYRGAVQYAHIATINVPWINSYRPELFWHAFEPVSGSHGPVYVYVFQRIDPPLSADLTTTP